MKKINLIFCITIFFTTINIMSQTYETTMTTRFPQPTMSLNVFIKGMAEGYVCMDTADIEEFAGVCGKIDCSIDWSSYKDGKGMKFWAFDENRGWCFRWLGKEENGDSSEYNFTINIMAGELDTKGYINPLFRVGTLYVQALAEVVESAIIQYEVTVTVNDEDLIEHKGKIYTPEVILDNFGSHVMISIYCK